ncbi:MAG: glycoside hydrolase family 16 protein [Phycisphaerales bacterium]|nr:glycoside hydrolase family 16 protein [Phycisphaerales bacterium]
MRFWLFILVLLWVSLLAWPRGESARGKHPSWALVWNDEFEGRRLDSQKWTVGNNSEPNYDGGINIYAPQDVGVANGDLVIRSHRLATAGKAAYSSGRVSTRNSFSFLYGRVEIRARLPGTKGVWPAMWMLRRDGVWPPEIDIMEMLGDNPHKIYMTNHWRTHHGLRQDQDSFSGPDFSAGFHVFALEWEPGSIRWLIDGVERKVMTEHVSDRAMYLIINTSVGGDWPGAPDKRTVFPQQFYVDYVRVYQRSKTGG